MTTDVHALLKESKAEYRQLGKSGLKVSVPILGAMSIGDKKWQPWVIEEEEALPLLKAAYDKGITSWDTGTLHHVHITSAQCFGFGVLHLLTSSYSQRLLQWRLRTHHRQSHKAVLSPPPQTSPHDQALRLCGRDSRPPGHPLPHRTTSTQRLHKPRRPLPRRHLQRRRGLARPPRHAVHRPAANPSI